MPSVYLILKERYTRYARYDTVSVTFNFDFYCRSSKKFPKNIVFSAEIMYNLGWIEKTIYPRYFSFK